MAANVIVGQTIEYFSDRNCVHGKIKFLEDYVIRLIIQLRLYNIHYNINYVILHS